MGEFNGCCLSLLFASRHFLICKSHFPRLSAPLDRNSSPSQHLPTSIKRRYYLRLGEGGKISAAGVLLKQRLLEVGVSSGGVAAAAASARPLEGPLIVASSGKYNN